MRLIDADKFITEGIKNKTIEVRKYDLQFNEMMYVSLLFHDIAELIDSQPTVNAVEVETAFQGCFEGCDQFEIEQEKLYANGEIIARMFRCSEIEKCRHLLNNLKAKENNHAN